MLETIELFIVGSSRVDMTILDTSNPEVYTFSGFLGKIFSFSPNEPTPAAQTLTRSEQHRRIKGLLECVTHSLLILLFPRLVLITLW